MHVLAQRTFGPSIRWALGDKTRTHFEMESRRNIVVGRPPRTLSRFVAVSRISVPGKRRKAGVDEASSPCATSPGSAGWLRPLGVVDACCQEQSRNQRRSRTVCTRAAWHWLFFKSFRHRTPHSATMPFSYLHPHRLALDLQFWSKEVSCSGLLVRQCAFPTIQRLPQARKEQGAFPAQLRVTVMIARLVRSVRLSEPRAALDPWLGLKAATC